MKIADFAVEMWMNDHETKAELNLAETCVASLTIEELLAIAGRNDASLAELAPLRMTYGAIEGSERLRTAIAALYEATPPENIVAAHGAIGANALVYQALVSAGDRVVAVTPTYQQHTAIPESLGAELRRLPLREEAGFAVDLDEMRRLVAGDARLIAINNPNNPTGALMDRDTLTAIAAIAREAGAYVLADEVYRGTDQDGPGITASMADIYEKGISTASVSKAFSLAGLRLGWVAGPREVIEAVMVHRDYNTISVGVLDDHFATMALENAEAVLARSRAITRGNLATLDAWMEGEPALRWVRPRAGTTALLGYGGGTPSRDLCLSILAETSVMFTPGAALEMEGYLRIGFANSPAVLEEGLARTSAFLARADLE